MTFGPWQLFESEDISVIHTTQQIARGLFPLVSQELSWAWFIDLNFPFFSLFLSSLSNLPIADLLLTLNWSSRRLASKWGRPWHAGRTVFIYVFIYVLFTVFGYIEAKTKDQDIWGIYPRLIYLKSFFFLSTSTITSPALLHSGPVFQSISTFLVFPLS